MGYIGKITYKNEPIGKIKKCGFKPNKYINLADWCSEEVKKRIIDEKLISHYHNGGTYYYECAFIFNYSNVIHTQFINTIRKNNIATSNLIANFNYTKKLLEGYKFSMFYPNPMAKSTYAMLTKEKYSLVGEWNAAALEEQVKLGTAKKHMLGSDKINFLGRKWTRRQLYTFFRYIYNKKKVKGKNNI